MKKYTRAIIATVVLLTISVVSSLFVNDKTFNGVLIALLSASSFCGGISCGLTAAFNWIDGE